MRVYLAARFSTQQAMVAIREVLKCAGHEITATWLDHTGPEVGVDGITPKTMNADPERCAPFAEQDMTDVLRSDVVVVFTHQPSSTGGRHVELGIALAAGKRVILCGDRENIFQTLPQIEQCQDWRELIKMLGDDR